MGMPAPRAGALAAVVILSLGLGACSKSSPSSTSNTTAPGAGSGSSTTAAAGAPGTITIKNFAFVPTPQTAKVGDTITVTNQDGTNHSLTADDGSFNTGVFSSGSKTITLTKAGTFTIHCMIHSFMTGKIVVTAG